MLIHKLTYDIIKRDYAQVYKHFGEIQLYRNNYSSIKKTKVDKDFKYDKKQAFNNILISVRYNIRSQLMY